MVSPFLQIQFVLKSESVIDLFHDQLDRQRDGVVGLAIEGEPRRHAYNVGGQLAPLRRWLELAAQGLSRSVDFLAVGGDTLAERLPDYHEPWEFHYNLFLDTCRAERELGFHPTPLGKWWPQIARWYAEQTDLHPSAGYDRRQEELDFARSWRAMINSTGHEITR